MGIKSHYLEDKDGNKFYPYAHANATFDENGVKVGARLNDIENNINTATADIDTHIEDADKHITPEEREKLSNISEGADVNVQSDWNVTDTTSDAFIKNKPTSLPANGGNADTVNGHSVNADVPSNAKFTDTVYDDTNLVKTVSNKVDKVSGKGLSTNDYTNEEKAQVEANKTDISLLKSDVESLQNDIVTTTDNTLYNSKAGGLRLMEMVGNTEQKTLTGKNLCSETFPKSNIDSNGVLVTDESVSAEFSMHIAKVESGKTYTIMSDDVNGLVCGFFESKPVIGSVSYDNSRLVQKEKVVTIPSGVTYIAFRTTNKYTTPQIEEGVIASPTFEPWCGGTPAPNPTHPIAIENVGDCVEMMQGYYSSGNKGIFATSDVRIANKNPIPCKKGDNIKIILPERYVGNILVYNGSTFLGNSNVASNNIIEYTVSDEATRFNFNVTTPELTEKITPQTVGKITLTINGKYVVPVKTRCKNLLGGVAFANAMTSSGATAIINNSAKTVRLTADSKASQFKFDNFKENTQYTIFYRGYNDHSASPLSTNLIIKYTDGTAEVLQFTGNNKQLLKITSPTKSVLCLSGSYSNGFAVFYYEDFGIFEGVLALEDFEPYTEHVEHILLDEPLRESDRLVRKDGVICENHKKGSVDLGTLNWYYNSGDKAFYSRFSNAKTSVTTRGIPCYCTHYMDINKTTIKNWAELSLVNNIISCGCSFIGGTQNESAIVVTNFAYTDPTEFKTAMSGVMVEYMLAEETFTPLDAESQKAINRLVTFNEVTYLEVDSKIKPSGIEVEYGTTETSALALKTYNEGCNTNLVIDELDLTYATKEEVNGKADKNHTHPDATTSASGLMSKTDKAFVDKLKATNLGNMDGKKVTELQSVLATWLTTYGNIPNASCYFVANSQFINYWNNNDTTSTIIDGVRWTVELNGSYGMPEWAMLKFTSYGDKNVYYVSRSNGVWGKLKRVVFSDDTIANATNADSATKATQDASGNVITSTYETKSDATAKLNTAKSYADTVATKVKNDLLNGAGGAYDTLKELGDLIDNNQDAIDALETVATSKADKVHSHAISDVSGLQSALDGKSSAGHNHAGENITSGTISSDRLPTVPISKGGTGATTAASALTNLGLTATATELNYMDGVTSSVQTQLDNRIVNNPFHSGGTEGTNGYVAFAQLTITSSYTNRPIEFELISRGRTTPCYVSISFANTDSKDPALNKLVYWGTNYGVFAHKTGTSTWLLYATKSEGYDSITVVRKQASIQGITITHPGTFTTTYPTSNVTNASLGGSIYSASTSDKVGTSTVGSATQPVYINAGVPTATTYTLGKSVPSDAKFTDTTYTSLKNPYALTIQGNGTTLTNGTYDGSAAKTVNITPASIGAAASSHGTHVSYGTSASALGTSSAGTATTVSRSDHVHALPALTSCTGTLTIAKGGTGATTAAGALTNLGLTATAAELNYMDGVTSNVQTQLNGKSKGSTLTATTAATAGWYRIATTPVGISNCTGIFEIVGAVSGNHTTAIITAGTSYGVAASSSIQVLQCSHFSGSAITKARIVYHTTYNSNYAYLEVYNPNAVALSFSVRLIGGTGWSLVAPNTAGSIPSGYSNKEVTLSNNTMVAGTFKGALSGNADTATNVAWSGVTSKPSYYDAKAIKSITRSGTTFTYTCMDGTTGTFTQQDNNTTYSAATSSALGLVKIGSNITNSSGTISISKQNVIDALGYTPGSSTDNNTTYTLTKSGSTITLTGSDGSKTSVTDSDANTDTKVSISANAPTSNTKYYLTMHTATSGTTAVTANAGINVDILTGTTSTEGYDELVLGNSTASGTANNATGRISLYSPGISYHNIKGASTNSSVTHTLPATTGTILNSGTTSFTASLTSGTKIGSIKINGTSTDVYAPTNTDTKVTQTYADYSGYTNWRPLIIGSSNNSTEGFTPATVTDTTMAFSTITAQPSTGTIRASVFKALAEGGLTGAGVLRINAGSTIYTDRGSSTSFIFQKGGAEHARFDTSGHLVPGTTKTYNIGSSDKVWNNIYATTFTGTLSGNATSATKATQDGSGNTITSTYATKTELNGKVSILTDMAKFPVSYGFAISRGGNTIGTSNASDNYYMLVDSENNFRIGTQLNKASEVTWTKLSKDGHTHSYAGSSSAGGSATSAVKLDSSAGSATQPVYFSGGKPVACTYTLGKSVPSNAVFTDTTYSVATTSANGLMSAADKTKLDGLSSGSSVSFTASATSGNKVGTITIDGTATDLYSPTQTTVSGNAGTATKLATTRKIDGLRFNGAGDVTRFCECSTTDTTADKTASTSTALDLVTGARVTVKFKYANNIANPTLNISGTGAKAIYYRGSAITADQYWRPNTVVDFVYDGTNWNVLGAINDNNTNTTYTNASLGSGYGTCTTEEATTAKTASLTSYSLVTGGVVAIKFTYAVPANATLSINSKTAKPIYHEGAAIKAGIIPAGCTATFVYNGTSYNLISVDRPSPKFSLSGTTLTITTT